MTVQQFSNLGNNKLYSTEVADYNLIFKCFEIIRDFRNFMFQQAQFTLQQTITEAVRNYTANNRSRNQPNNEEDYRIVLNDAISQIDEARFTLFIQKISMN